MNPKGPFAMINTKPLFGVSFVRVLMRNCFIRARPHDFFEISY